MLPPALIAFRRTEPTNIVPTCAIKHKEEIGATPSRRLPVRPVMGALSMAMEARSRGLARLIVPLANAREASVVRELEVYGVGSLADAVGIVTGAVPLDPVSPPVDEIEGRLNKYIIDFADVKAIMAGMGYAVMGTSTARGDQRATEAAQRAIASPLLEAGATHVCHDLGEVLALLAPDIPAGK